MRQFHGVCLGLAEQRSLIDNLEFFLCSAIPAAEDTSDSQMYVALAVKRPVL